MRPVDINKFKYRDNLLTKRRQRVRAWSGLGLFGVLLLIAAIGYGLFYTPWLQVTAVEINGLSDQHEQEVRTAIGESLDRRILGVPVYRNLFFNRSGSLAAIVKNFAFIQGTDVSKNYPHGLMVKATERQLEGIWCRGPFDSAQGRPVATTCSYFDHSGAVWGNASQSSGSLLLNVDDLRVASGSAAVAIDQYFLRAIEGVVPALSKLGLAVNKVVIPTGSFTEFEVIILSSSSGTYPIKFSLDSYIPGQLEVYRIFRAQKTLTDGFQPQYIDLRFDGRVYYK